MLLTKPRARRLSMSTYLRLNGAPVPRNGCYVMIGQSPFGEGMKATVSELVACYSNQAKSTTTKLHSCSFPLRKTLSPNLDSH